MRANLDLADIIATDQFTTFRSRNTHPEVIPSCEGCSLLRFCRGGCAGRAYLHHAHTTGKRTLFARDPYCPRDLSPPEPFPQDPKLPTDQRLVHMDYLCTWIGKPHPVAPDTLEP